MSFMRWHDRLMLESDVQPDLGLRAGLAATGELSAHNQPTTFVWSTDHRGQIRRELPGWEAFTGQTVHAWRMPGGPALRRPIASNWPTGCAGATVAGAT
jgi:hypothetical protein